MEDRGQPQWSSLSLSTLFSEIRSLARTEVLLTRLDWLASEPRGPSATASPVMGSQMHSNLDEFAFWCISH